MEALRVGCMEPVGPCSVCGAALCTGPGGLAAGPGPAPASPPWSSQRPDLGPAG